MSYCHLNVVGISFSKGFIGQPGTVIRNRVASARVSGCLRSDCGNSNDEDVVVVDTDTDDESDGDDDCRERSVTVRLILDNFGSETRWSLRSQEGEVITSGGPYENKLAGTLIEETHCLPYGCYDFEITDEYGDGICCGSGDGSFIVRVADGTVLGQGAQFGSRATINFCFQDEQDDGDEPEDPDEPNDPEPEGSDCAPIDFDQYQPATFGTMQDDGRFEILDDGRTIYVERNGWKAIDFVYDLTADTRLEFWFRSDREGEMHGIGMDINQIISANLTFRLFGTQPWGISDYDTYPGAGEWKFYSIPIGRFYIGRVNHLFFAADEDKGAKRGNSYFRDVVLLEGDDCVRTLPSGEKSALSGQVAELKLYPNPARDRLTVEGLEVGSHYRILDLSGRVLQSGLVKSPKMKLVTHDLGAGVYLLDYAGPRVRAQKKFIVLRK